jgi:hypothetical protein
MTKTAKLIPNKAQKTEDYPAKLTPAEIGNLYEMSRSVGAINMRVPETISFWMYKNNKKLKKAYDKAIAASDTIDNEYVEKNDRGEFALGPHGDDPLAYLQFDKKTGRNNFVDKDGNRLPKNQFGELPYYVRDEKRREEYQAKKLEFAETTMEVNLVRISRELLASVEIPTILPMSQASAPLDLFYDYLVIQDENKEDEEGDSSESKD